MFSGSTQADRWHSNSPSLEQARQEREAVPLRPSLQRQAERPLRTLFDVGCSLLLYHSLPEYVFYKRIIFLSPIKWDSLAWNYALVKKFICS